MIQWRKVIEQSNTSKRNQEEEEQMKVKGNLYKGMKLELNGYKKTIGWTEAWEKVKGREGHSSQCWRKVCCTCQSCLCSCNSSSTMALYTAIFIVSMYFFFLKFSCPCWNWVIVERFVYLEIISIYLPSLLRDVIFYPKLIFFLGM